ncbi:phthiocerol synthesis polyketide synthase type I [Streptomyces turgidiscabies]|nr:phthiocerol synthesis polyketide synthase type I [Streptomyces turgidiscabies]
MVSPAIPVGCCCHVGARAGADPVSRRRASALPVAGVAALRSLRAAGLGPDKRVLVTGASGGVGRFAVQLAARAGAHVIASVGSTARGEGLAEAGADEVLIGLEGLERPVDVVIDNVGGPQLVLAWNLLTPGGSVQSVGWTSGEPAAFPPYATVGPAKSLTSFVIEGDAGADLAVLTELAAEGALSVEIGRQGSWDRFEEAAEALGGRRISGKAVPEVASGQMQDRVVAGQDSGIGGSRPIGHAHVQTTDWAGSAASRRRRAGGGRLPCRALGSRGPVRVKDPGADQVGSGKERAVPSVLMRPTGAASPDARGISPISAAPMRPGTARA